MTNVLIYASTSSRKVSFPNKCFSYIILGCFFISFHRFRPCLAWLQLWVELLHSRTLGGANFELSWNCLMEQLWVELELQKRCSKTPPPFALQLHRVGSSKEFWSWGVWLEFLLELLEFWSGAMPNTPLV